MILTASGVAPRRRRGRAALRDRTATRKNHCNPPSPGPRGPAPPNSNPEPNRRRTEILARARFAELIIGRALLGTLEHFVGLADLLEARLGILLLADVRMIFAGQFAVGLLDLRLSRIAATPMIL